MGDMAVPFLLVFRFLRLLLSGHQAVVLENAALPNANRRVSARAKAAAAVDLGPGVLDYPPQPMGRLAQAVALRPARYSCAMAARAVPEILGQVVPAAAPGPRSPTHRRGTPPIDRTNGRRQSAVARTQDSCELKMLGIAISERTVSRLLRTLRRPSNQTWRTFLHNHIGQMVSTDFFTVKNELAAHES